MHPLTCLPHVHLLSYTYPLQVNAVKNEEASQISKLNEEINALKKRLESGQGLAADTRWFPSPALVASSYPCCLALTILLVMYPCDIDFPCTSGSPRTSGYLRWWLMHYHIYFLWTILSFLPPPMPTLSYLLSHTSSPSHIYHPHTSTPSLSQRIGSSSSSAAEGTRGPSEKHVGSQIQSKQSVYLDWLSVLIYNTPDHPNLS